MKKVISYSLWGDSEGYLIGGIINADIAKWMWPEWICRFYIAPDVPKCIIEELKKRDNVEVVLMDKTEGWNGMFWRFYPCSDESVDVMISRDCDSRLNVRDKAAVDEWLESDKDFHTMRDNCQHGMPICGGMWGARNGIISDMKELIDSYERKRDDNNHGIDQHFLRDVIYPKVSNSVYAHDDWFPQLMPHEEKHPFPIPRLKGYGWWKNEFPEWHCGNEDDRSKWEIGIIDEDIWYDKEKKEYKPAPCCGVHHDNEYIGKQEKVYGRDRLKYKDIIIKLEEEIYE